MLMRLLLTRMNHFTQIMSRTPVEQRLRVLAVAHFILAMLTGTISALAMISALAFSASMSRLLGGTETSAFSFYLYFGAGTSMAGLALSGITAAAGWNLLTRRWGAFGLALELATLCLFPFGTILATVTLVVLVRRPVQDYLGMASQPANSQ